MFVVRRLRIWGCCGEGWNAVHSTSLTHHGVKLCWLGKVAGSNLDCMATCRARCGFVRGLHETMCHSLGSSWWLGRWLEGKGVAERSHEASCMASSSGVGSVLDGGEWTVHF